MDADRDSEDGEISRVVQVGAQGKSCNHCGDSGHNARHCPNKVREEKAGNRCGYCCDMAHRRQRPRCKGCKKPWEPEVIVHSLPSPGSGLGDTNV